MDELRALVQELVRAELQRAPLPQGDPTGEFLTTSQAAAAHSITSGTIRRWIREGRLEKHTLGGRIRIRRAELEALMQRGPKPRSTAPTLSPEMRAQRDLAAMRGKLVDD